MHTLSHSLSHMKVSVELRVTNLQRHRASKRKQQKAKSSLLSCLCVCVYGWAFFLSEKGEDLKTAKSQYPCRSPQGHTHTHTHTTCILSQSTAANAAWMSGEQRKKQSKEAGERGGDISGATCCCWSSVWIEDDILVVYPAAVGLRLRWVQAFHSTSFFFWFVFTS